MMNPPKAINRDGGYSAHPVVKSFLSGSVSGFCSTILFQPFDLVKTRLQAPPTACYSTTPSEVGHGTPILLQRPAKVKKKASMASVVRQVVRQDGIKGLWHGVTPSLARTVPGVGLYFGFLHSLKTSFHLHDRRLSSKETFLLGAASRVAAAGVLMPFTVIKARFESGLFDYRSVTHALLLISRTEGVKGLWSGMVATILRDGPYSGLYLMFYTRAKDSAKLIIQSSSSSSSSNHSDLSSTSQRFLQYIPLSSVHFLCSILAGVLASAATQPPDVVKTQMQLHPARHRNVAAAVVFLWRHQGGVGAFFAGFVPRTLRRTLMAAATWTVYEQLMAWMGLTGG